MKRQRTCIFTAPLLFWPAAGSASAQIRHAVWASDILRHVNSKKCKWQNQKIAFAFREVQKAEVKKCDLVKSKMVHFGAPDLFSMEILKKIKGPMPNCCHMSEAKNCTFREAKMLHFGQSNFFHLPIGIFQNKSPTCRRSMYQPLPRRHTGSNPGQIRGCDLATSQNIPGHIIFW